MDERHELDLCGSLSGRGVNNLTIAGWNNKGQAVGGASASLSVTFTGVIEPLDRIVINELMHNPAQPDTEFVEIVNTATNTAHDLSNWRLNGLDGTILPGTILQPGAFLVFAKTRRNSGAFTAVPFRWRARSRAASTRAARRFNHQARRDSGAGRGS